MSTQDTRALDAHAAIIELEALPSAEVVAGSPSAGALGLGALGGCDYGLWEMIEGAATDVEAEEVFVVLSGAATVSIEPFGGEGELTLTLAPGSVVHLQEGMRTTWTVTEPLRKVWFALSED